MAAGSDDSSTPPKSVGRAPPLTDHPTSSSTSDHWAPCRTHQYDAGRQRQPMDPRDRDTTKVSRRAPPLLSASRHPAVQVMILPLQHGHKKEWPTGRDIPPHEVEHSGAAPRPTRNRRSAGARSAGEPIGFLQAARTLAEIKKSEKPAEHRYKLSSEGYAQAAVPTTDCDGLLIVLLTAHRIPRCVARTERANNRCSQCALGLLLIRRSAVAAGPIQQVT